MMFFLLDAAQGDFNQPAGLIPACLVLALFFAEIFYYSYMTRVITCISISWFSLAALRSAKMSNPAISYIMGVAGIWNIVWSVVMLLIHDPPRDLKRIVSRQVQDPKEKDIEVSVYRWEGMPKRLSWDRFLWAVEMLFNMRGLCWNVTKPLASAPEEVKILYSSDTKDQDSKITTEGAPAKPSISQTRTKASFLRRRTLAFMLDYILIDIVTYFTDRDPYFFGKEPARFDNLASLAKMQSRLLLCAASLGLVIDIQFKFMELIAVGLLGPRWLGIFGEPWMHPVLWGSPMEIYHKGLLGFWGKFWHPLFKFGYQEICDWLIPPAPKSKSEASKSLFTLRSILRLHLVFGISGLIHASGSSLTPGTNPWLSFLAFFLQAPGIVLQEVLRAWLKKMGAGEVVQKMVVFVFVLAWSMGSMPLLIGDMAAARFWEARALPFCIIGCRPR